MSLVARHARMLLRFLHRRPFFGQQLSADAHLSPPNVITMARLSAVIGLARVILPLRACLKPYIMLQICPSVASRIKQWHQRYHQPAPPCAHAVIGGSENNGRSRASACHRVINKWYHQRLLVANEEKLRPAVGSRLIAAHQEMHHAKPAQQANKRKRAAVK